MSVFKDYSAYYNLLYADKDYAGEADYVASLVKQYAPDAKSVLDIGCGTGRHAKLIADKGYRVHGVDFSEDMISVAKEDNVSGELSFSIGDARSFELDEQFDVVVSLFHVLSYMNSNEDAQAFFTQAKKHVKPGGLLIFDFWYGPAVMSSPPETRIKEMSDEAIEVTRFCYPEVHFDRNVVDVNYKVLVKDKGSNQYNEIREKHPMRYYFQPELRLLLAQHGLELVGFHEWMTTDVPNKDSWSVVGVVKKSSVE